MGWTLNNADRLIAWSVVVLALAVFGVTLARAVWYMPAWDLPDGTALALSASVGAPVISAFGTTSPGLAPTRLRIPAIGVDARVQNVGITKRGNIGIPTNFTDVAWYARGVAPGIAGTAVFDGHVNNGFGLPGVFKRLSELKPGDEILVRNRGGNTVRFVIYDLQSYLYTNVPMALILAPRNDAELVLITCEGSWLARERTYDRRLVVYAKLQT